LANSFGSTALFTLARQVRRGQLVLIEVVSKMAALAVMITWAVLSPTVWALVAGSLTSSVVTTAASHMLRVGYRNGFAWDRSAARELRDFGKWVLGSSGLTFAAEEGDRLLLGYFLPLAAMGVYSIASILSVAFGAIIVRLTSSVVYGVLTTAARERPDDLGRLYYASRLRLDLLAQPALGAVAVLAPIVVGILYDERYAAAGWMLQLLCIRVALSSLHHPASTCLVARGEPKQAMIGNAWRALVTWVGVPIGFHLFGVKGAIWALVASELAVLLAFNLALHRRRILRVRRELIPVGLFLGGLVLGSAVRSATQPLAANVIEWSHSIRK
jgi:O-antigen/teichoic acid export membrane protein